MGILSKVFGKKKNIWQIMNEQMKCETCGSNEIDIVNAFSEKISVDCRKCKICTIIYKYK